MNSRRDFIGRSHNEAQCKSQPDKSKRKKQALGWLWAALPGACGEPQGSPLSLPVHRFCHFVCRCKVAKIEPRFLSLSMYRSSLYGVRSCQHLCRMRIHL